MATKAIGLILLAIIAAALVWSGAEQHYRACVEARFVTGAGSTSGAFRWDDDQDPVSHASVKGCKRLPF